MKLCLWTHITQDLIWQSHAARLEGSLNQQMKFEVTKSCDLIRGNELANEVLIIGRTSITTRLIRVIVLWVLICQRDP